MSGNVWEWCYDWYSDSVGAGNVTDPVGAASDSRRVERGGRWSNNAGSCSVTYRGFYHPGGRYDNLGFRLVRSVN